jgi:hypothetical protein
LKLLKIVKDTLNKIIQFHFIIFKHFAAASLQNYNFRRFKKFIKKTNFLGCQLSIEKLEKIKLDKFLLKQKG